LRNVIAKAESRPRPDVRRVQYREHVISYIEEAGEEFHVDLPTLGSAMYYFDTITSQASVRKSELKIAAAACFMLACKIEEPESSLPTAEQIINHGFVRGTPADLVEWESIILSVLGFRTQVVTFVHLVNWIRSMACLIETNRPLHAVEASRLEYKVMRSLEFFIKLAQSEAAMQLESPVEMACAVVTCSRAALECFERNWTDALEQVTGVPEARFNVLHDRLYSLYQTVEARADTSPNGVDYEPPSAGVRYA